MKQNKSCSNCIMGRMISVNSDILCREQGAVSPDYVCSQHRFAPQPKNLKELNYKCVDCECFVVEIASTRSNAVLGLCRLFSGRRYDGSQRKACSKLIKRSQREVS